MTVSCGNGLITRLNLRINSTKETTYFRKRNAMAKKGEIDNNVLSKESAAFIYKTEKCQRKFVGFPSQKDR